MQCHRSNWSALIAMDFTILDLSYEKTSEEYNSNVRLDALGSATAEIIFS